MENAFVPGETLKNCNSFYSLNSCYTGSERKIKYGDRSLGERYGLIKGDSSDCLWMSLSGLALIPSGSNTVRKSHL